MTKASTYETFHNEIVPEQCDARDEKRNSVAEDARQEHTLTLREVFKNHRPLAGWTFFWALCAVGW